MWYFSHHTPVGDTNKTPLLPYSSPTHILMAMMGEEGSRRAGESSKWSRGCGKTIPCSSYPPERPILRLYVVYADAPTPTIFIPA
jgi:hypothetical protein